MKAKLLALKLLNKLTQPTEAIPATAELSHNINQ